MVECRDVRDDEEGFVKDRRHRRPEPGGGGRSEDADGCEHSSASGTRVHSSEPGKHRGCMAVGFPSAGFGQVISKVCGDHQVHGSVLAGHGIKRRAA